MFVVSHRNRVLLSHFGRLRQQQYKIPFMQQTTGKDAVRGADLNDSVFRKRSELKKSWRSADFPTPRLREENR